MEEKTAVTSLSALAQSMRLRVFRVLIGVAPPRRDPGGVVCHTRSASDGLTVGVGFGFGWYGIRFP